METSIVKLKDGSQKTKKSSSKVLYVAAAVVAVFAVALLIDNIMLFKNNVAQYVAQGYPASEVLKQLIPGQLLPGIVEPLALYLGIAFILWGLGLINQKIPSCLVQSKDELSPDAAKEHISEAENAQDLNIDTIEEGSGKRS